MCILFNKGTSKAEYRWAKGIWLGVREESGDHIIGTDKGVMKVRALRRTGSHAERWDWDEVQKMKGAPWEPVPGRPDIEIQTRIVYGNEREKIQELNVGETKHTKRIQNTQRRYSKTRDNATLSGMCKSNRGRHCAKPPGKLQKQI